MNGPKVDAYESQLRKQVAMPGRDSSNPEMNMAMFRVLNATGIKQTPDLLRVVGIAYHAGFIVGRERQS